MRAPGIWVKPTYSFPAGGLDLEKRITLWDTGANKIPTLTIAERVFSGEVTFSTMS
jgi:hypothetical protein